VIYSRLADLVVVVHFLFILFVIFGGLFSFASSKWALLHVPAVLWGAGTEFFGLICPLTPLENRLRLAADSENYPGGFIDHYLVPIIYPDGLTREIQLVLGVFVLLLNLLVYAAVMARKLRQRDMRRPGSSINP
jgi:hypothetical protein